MTQSPTQLKRGGFPVTPEQASIVDHVAVNPVTVVAAGAGSGKTYTTVATVLHLIETAGASIDQFVLITFTNKAANDLRERIQDALDDRARNAGSTQERFLWRTQQERLAAAYVGTIHSFCRWMLRLFAYSQGVARESGITFAARLKRDAIRHLLEDHLAQAPAASLYGGRSEMADYELEKLFAGLHDYILNQGLTADQVLAETQQQSSDFGRPYRIQAAQFAADLAEDYAAKKLEAQVLDAHDLLRKSSDLFQSPHGPAIAGRIAARYRYLFIDEFQDTDAVQMEIVNALRQRLKAVLVVGDIKQSIYAYRGAQSRLMLALAKKAQTQILDMTVSRRPTRRLLAAQTALFSSVASYTDQQGRQPFAFLNKALNPYSGSLSAPNDPDPIWYINASTSPRDRPAQIRATADAIEHLVGQTIARRQNDQEIGITVEPGHIAVLGRSNPICQEYAVELGALLWPKGILVRLDKGESFYQRPEIASTTYMLQLLLEHPDDTALCLALDTPYLASVDATDPIRQEVQAPRGGPQITRWFQHHYPDLHDQLETLRALTQTITVPQLLEELYRRFEIRDYYVRAGDAEAAQNLDHLREIARDLFAEDQALSLHTFVDHLRRATLTAQEEGFVDGGDDGPAPYVRVMTMHRAKGLEFPVVVIPEVQAPIVKDHDDREPDYLVIPGHGLEIKINLGEDPATRLPFRTVSNRYNQAVRRDRQDTQAEEMRVFYVAVTRAENVCVLVGSGDSRVQGPSSPYYSWRDEILRARGALRKAGAQIK